MNWLQNVKREELNYPETIAYIASHLQEAARDGMSVAEVMQYGSTLLTVDDVIRLYRVSVRA